MDDAVLRLLIVGAVGLVAGVSSVAARRGVAVRRSSLDPVGLDTGIHLFSSNSCASCDRARAVLIASGRTFEEHEYETASELHVDNGIDRVPAIAWVSASDSSRSAWIAMGVPSRRALDRWLGP